MPASPFQATNDELPDPSDPQDMGAVKQLFAQLVEQPQLIAMVEDAVRQGLSLPDAVRAVSQAADLQTKPTMIGAAERSRRRRGGMQVA